MRVNHQRRLLNKAAEARDYQITIRQRADASWPGDHSRLTALESTGHLRRIDPLEDPGGPVAVWQITAAGLSQLRALTSGSRVMASVKIRATDDGTFVVYRNGAAVASGLTREQAERCATVLGWIAQGR